MNNRRSWRESFTIYFQRPVYTMVFLGFSAGLPFLLVFSTLTAWLTDAGISRTTIGFFAWVGITYSIKVFWAPVVDRLRIPLVTTALGKRRGWILVGQMGIAGGLIGLALVDPANALAATAFLALVVAFSSSTQDIAIDAYRIEAVVIEYQGAMSAAYIFGYRVALLVAGAGALYLAEYFDWRTSYLAMASLMSLGVITTLVSREPDHAGVQETRLTEERVIEFLSRSAHLPGWLRELRAWLIGAVVCPFTDFFQRNGVFAFVILVFIGVFRLSDIAMGIMANPFYLDIGFTKAEIASIAKLFGFFMTIAGSALCGMLVVRLGVYRPLLLGAVLVAATNLLFALLAAVEPTLAWLAIVISADNVSGGIASTAFVAYLSSLTNRAYTATQYALFSSLMTLPGKFISGFSGTIVDGYGYVHFFIFAASIGVPAILLVPVLMRKEARATRVSLDELSAEG